VLITTERLALRRFRAADAEALAAYRSDPDVARYQSWTPPVTIERAR
jgi:RimJ/RimL family protein N-acetyltransferase